MRRHTLSFTEAVAEPLTVRNAEIVDLSMVPSTRLRQLSWLAGLPQIRTSFLPAILTRKELIGKAECLEIALDQLDTVHNLENESDFVSPSPGTIYPE